MTRRKPLTAAMWMALLASPVLMRGQVQYFDDVPASASYFGTANLIWNRQITHGCSYDPHLFCPANNLTRGDASVLIVRSIYSALTGNAEGFTPPLSPFFTDVPATHPRFPYIQQLKNLGITVGCTATTFCPDDLVTNIQFATFAVRARQIIDSSIVSGGAITQIGSVNNGISCPTDFSCSPYFPGDMTAADPRFQWVQKARELAGPMIQPPNCPAQAGGPAFCPDAAITRSQTTFFLVYAVLGQPGLPPQLPTQGGNGAVSLPPVTGIDCTSPQLNPITYWSAIYLVDSLHFFAQSSTSISFNDPSLWTVRVTSTVAKDGATLFGPQTASSDMTASLQFPVSALAAGRHLESSSHPVFSGPCNYNATFSSYSFPGTGASQYLPPTLTAVTPASAVAGAATPVTLTGIGLKGGYLSLSTPGATATTDMANSSDTLITGVITLPASTTPGAATVGAVLTNGGNYATNALPFTVVGSGGALPSPWISQDIGATGMAGNASYNAGVFSVSGSGAQVFGASDSFRYVYQPSPANVSLIAHLSSFQTGSANSKVGLMLRDTLDPASNNVFLAAHAGGAIEMQVRSSAGTTTVAAWGPYWALVKWLKLVQTNSSVSGYTSPDGVTWTLLTTVTVTFATAGYTGLAVTAENAGALAIATFDNVSVGSGGATVT